MGGKATPNRSGVGDRGLVRPGDRREAPVPLGRCRAIPGARQPRSTELPPDAHRLLPQGGKRSRMSPDDRGCLGMDLFDVRGLPRVPILHLPRVLRGLLRPGPPGTTWWLVGDAP